MRRAAALAVPVRTLSWSIFSHFVPFILEMCAAAKNCEQFSKIPSFESSRSFKVIDVDKTKKPVISACYDKQHVCIPISCFHTRRANSSKNVFLGGYPSLKPFFEGTPSPRSTKFCHKKLESLC